VSSPQQPPIAIVGMAAIMPGAGDLAAYWRNVAGGVDAIREVPPNRWDAEFYDPDADGRPDRVYVRRGGFVDEPATFQPLRFGLMPNSLADIEPDQLLALNVTAAAIEDAGGADKLPDADRIGVILGRLGTLSPGQTRFAQRVITPEQVLSAMRELLPDLPQSEIERFRVRFDERFGRNAPEGSVGTSPNFTASRIANRFDLRGPAFTIDGACASSLLAVDQGIAALTAGKLDAVIAGGLHHSHDISLWAAFSQLKALSRSGAVRSFAAHADGLLIGEGTGIVVLKRLADAERDDDRIYAVIRGCGVSSDGRSASMFNPTAPGQVLAIRRAWESAGLDPRAAGSIGLLEAHGTATPTGDQVELTAIAEAFGPASGERAVIGSVKSMIGHTMAAAGVAGLIKAAMAIHHRVLPPTLHCETPRAELAGTRFAPVAEAVPWTGDEPRRAGVNAFGFGGVNAHIILEEPRRRPARRTAAVAASEPEQMLWLSADSPAALAHVLTSDASELRETGAVLPEGGDNTVAGPTRLGLIDPTDERIDAARRVVARGAAWRGGRDFWFAPRPLLGVGAGKLAFVFPGFEAEFEPRVADVAAHFGLPARDWSATDLGSQGRQLIEVGRLLSDALSRMGIVADAVAGHSTGEWTAAAVSGQMSDATIDRVVDLFHGDKGKASERLFAVASASAEVIRPLLAAHPRVLLTHDNSPNQSVVNGPAADVEQFVAMLRARRILCWLMPFRSASHTPAFATYLGPVIEELPRLEILRPRVPIWSATVAAPFPDDPAQAIDLIVRHMMEPVLFRQTVEAMHDDGIRAFLQLGPGQLGSLIQDTLHDREHLVVPVNVARRSGIDQLRRVATAIWVEGGTPDMAALRPRAADATPVVRPGRRVMAPAPPRGPVLPLDLGTGLLRLNRPPQRESRAAGSRTTQPEAEPPTTVPPIRPPVAVSAADGGQATLAALRRRGRGRLADELGALMAENGGGPDRAAPVEVGTVLRREDIDISVEAMPYLEDHCFLRQPAGWPTMEDRRPVVPAATILELMTAAAARAVPGARVTGIRDARFLRWVVAAPAQTVVLTVRHAGPGLLSVWFGNFARAQVETSTEPPASPPRLWQPDLAGERAPTRTAQDMYTERQLFHGPRFQGMREILAIGDQHVRGALVAPEAPGALFDSGLQIVANWMVTTQPKRTLALPVGFERVDYYGAPPAAGDECQAYARFVRVDEGEVVVDLQFSTGDRVWAELRGTWRRFDTHPTAGDAERFPERFGLSIRQPEGWMLVFDCWTDPTSRASAAFSVLGSAGAAMFHAMPIARRAAWMLGRIAVKDAVRHRQWDAGTAEVFPIELTVTNDPDGRPRVINRPGAGLLDCDVSLAHTAEVAVAIALPREPDADQDASGVGIDVTAVTPVGDSTIGFALTPAERHLLEAVAGPDRDLWFARFWSAKEAAGKARHTGLDGNPKHLVVISAAGDELVVQAGTERFRVAFREVSNPPELPPRRYTVAWTWGPETGTHDRGEKDDR